MTVTMRKEGRVGYVVLDNPPVNAIGLELRQGLLDAVDWAEAEQLERVILSGVGRVFAAGGDAREFSGPPVEPHLPDVLNRIETSDVPWIAAAHGAALGGGLELMLACRYRVVAPGTQLGLPEVTLGVVPGAGGTQRLPRLIGLDHALAMIPTGKSISAEEAKELCLIDEIDADPVFFAETTNPEWLGMQVPVGERNINPPAAGAFDTARATAKRKMPGQTAPLVAIDLLEAAQSLPLAQGLAQEREAFITLRTGEQATALRHVFFGERAAKAPDWLADATPNELTQIAVVGGGTMGAGIAYALLSAGYSVVVLETDPDGVARAQKNLDALFASGRKRGLLDDAGEQSRRAALTISDNYAQAANAGLAIEAAFESMDVKHAVLGKLEAVLAPEAVLATNTSYLDIDVMAAKLADPTRLVGLHFFAPAHIMKLLEIVRGARTSDTALKTGFALAKTLKKVPVLSGVCDGFIGNRILARYREAADTLLMDGATPAEVDAAMVAFGYAMGPYEAQDMSGLDIAHVNRRRQDATRDPDRRYIPIGDRLVDMGRLGKKTGSGWYDYRTGAKQPDDAVVEIILAEAQREAVTRRAFSADEIQHRLLLAMINEAADILNEGIAAQALDIDLVTVFGYGFPRWRGGLTHYADTLGPQKVLVGLHALATEDPKVWSPSPMIQDAAARGLSFAEWMRGV